MSAAANNEPSRDDAKSAAVSDEVARTAAQALERLQRAADRVAADAADVARKETATKENAGLKATFARAPERVAAMMRSDWGRAAAASGLCAAAAFAAIMGLRDGANPDARRAAASKPRLWSGIRRMKRARCRTCRRGCTRCPKKCAT